MKSYIYPKLLREEMQKRYADDPDARSERVNQVLLETDPDMLARMGLRRARQSPRVPYEPFGVAVTDDALRVLRGLPSSASRSALIQQILSC
ncbi:hypothetical protein [Acidithiobacillus ferriphilus]|jgi:hypothetical protein|uniref:hypothetical protein n=1 Tax=Acidithiobacillus ferriphilus TaxID=1689834 RepID=UPI001C0653DC|nr:hypothetical protein [Acidithiobacillus ferriphilus]MBU2833003.1 hypothetical protein [Acidithiobacillus ferriphilus]